MTVDTSGNDGTRLNVDDLEFERALAMKVPGGETAGLTIVEGADVYLSVNSQDAKLETGQKFSISSHGVQRCFVTFRKCRRAWRQYPHGQAQPRLRRVGQAARAASHGRSWTPSFHYSQQLYPFLCSLREQQRNCERRFVDGSGDCISHCSMPCVREQCVGMSEHGKMEVLPLRSCMR